MSPSLPNKKDVLIALLERSSVFVHLDPRAEPVRVPKWFKRQPQLVLQIGLNLAVQIPDLQVTDEGVSCTLSFSRSPFYCYLPWSAIYALVAEDGRGMVWPDDIPPEVVVQSSPASQSSAPPQSSASQAAATPQSPAPQAPGSQAPGSQAASRGRSVVDGSSAVASKGELGVRAPQVSSAGAARSSSSKPRSPSSASLRAIAGGAPVSENRAGPVSGAASEVARETQEAKGLQKRVGSQEESSREEKPRQLPSYLRVVK